MDNKRIYIDTEYAYQGMFSEKRAAKEDDQKEIIQIAAILYNNDTGVEEARMDTLVKPFSLMELPPFF